MWWKREKNTSIISNPIGWKRMRDGVLPYQCRVKGAGGPRCQGEGGWQGVKKAGGEGEALVVEERKRARVVEEREA